MMTLTELTELAEEFESLTREKKAVADQEKSRAERMAVLEDKLLEAMGEAGLQNLKLTSGMTLYRAVEKFWGVAEGCSREQLVRELGRHQQTMDLVAPSYNANSLRARIREIEENGEELPAALQAILRVTEKDRVRHKS